MFGRYVLGQQHEANRRGRLLDRLEQSRGGRGAGIVEPLDHDHLGGALDRRARRLDDHTTSVLAHGEGVPFGLHDHHVGVFTPGGETPGAVTIGRATDPLAGQRQGCPALARPARPDEQVSVHRIAGRSPESGHGSRLAHDRDERVVPGDAHPRPKRSRTTALTRSATSAR